MSLISLAQNLDRIANREYPYFQMPIVSEIKKVLFKNDINLLKEYIFKNESLLEKYPVIYKHLKKEISEYQ
jgi:hypothetical protein